MATNKAYLSISIIQMMLGIFIAFCGYWFIAWFNTLIGAMMILMALVILATAIMTLLKAKKIELF